MPICSNCSNPIDDKTRFCPYCDAPVQLAGPTSKGFSGGTLESSNQISCLMTRYKDAYLTAKVTDGFGSLIKAIGFIAGGLLVLLGFIFAANARAGDATFAVGVILAVFGILVGLQLYVFGVLVSAQGQILMASLDSAVNSSPFLANEFKAKIMSLPE